MLRIKEILKSKNITQTELAEKLGITQVALSKTLNGNPTVETLQKIADALGVHVSDLFTPDDEHFRTLYVKDTNGDFKEFGKVRKD